MTTKRHIMALGLLVGLTVGARASVVGDTIVIENAEKVKIETRDTVQRIVISGSKDDPYFHYIQRISIPDTQAVRREMTSIGDFNRITVKNKNGRKAGVDFSWHLGLGLGTMTGAPNDYKFKVWPSWEWTLGMTANWHPKGPRNVWSTGLLLNWRTFRMDDGAYLAKTAQDELVLTPYDTSVQSKRRSWLSTFSLQVPLLYTHTFDAQRRWALTVGALVNVNTGASAWRHYKLGGETYDVKTGSLGQRPVTIDAVAMLRTPFLPTVYCKYSPMTMFKDGRGPKMHQLTFGFCF